LRSPVSVVEPVPPFPTARVPVRRLVPIEVVATSLPVESVLRRALVRELNHVLPVLVNPVVDALVNWVNAV
jgi:hypothetical protein